MLALGGIFFAADLAAWHLGIEQTKLANATLFGNAASFLFPIYGFLAARMLPSRSQAAALALAAAGAVLLLGQSYELSPQNLVGDLLSLLAGIFYTVYLVAIDTARRRLDPWRVLAFTTVAGLAPMLLFAHLLGEAIWPRAWWSLAGLAVVSQLLGQGFLVYAMGHVRPVVVGVAFLLQPIMSAVIGWVVYAEAMGAADLVGASAIAAAIVLVRRGSAEGGSLEVALKDAKDEA
ncbi:drug/metabolite transporter (DMT)-like permease [Sphingomonas jejuensis]|uniref:Drug/metabolite transporter (DMT)-like permease n=2 Tax=Sphingomonas jejuensis TaxID=904715 RepID=A0ABX0XNE8_9SPHN|nr:drug/metabolite transporter (DMT)-like permease [Sphingomonas jejuensis]